MNGEKKFSSVAMNSDNPKWDACILRNGLYNRSDDIRTPFARDYTRILHSTAYRRLKHKTQVFFATTNDHICTRIEHVNHVNSVSKTISNYLGLNSELTDSISIGHDLGHAPFGHEGEITLKSIIGSRVPGTTFWHEKNSLRFVDQIETLEGPEGKHHNLSLTYAVRDGIVCHCGEVNENSLIPREEILDLNKIEKAGQVPPYTWEGCVVKISDKISYLGRDIEDAVTLGLLESEQMSIVDGILRKYGISDSLKLNNTVLIHSFIIDLCENSSPQVGLKMSKEKLNLMNEIKDFCNSNIYTHPKVERYKKFVGHILKDLFEILAEISNDYRDTNSKTKKYYPTLFEDFMYYLRKYSQQYVQSNEFSEIFKIYDMDTESDRYQACIDFIAGMTDQYAIKKFKEAITF